MQSQRESKTMEIDIEISEVGPRDGLQSLSSIMPTEAKKSWIKAQFEAGTPEFHKFITFILP